MKNIKNKSLVTVILASGLGQRAKKSIPKQYLTLNNKTLLEININKFLSLEIINKIIVVINKNHNSYYKNLLKKYNNIDFIYGGDSRQESSLNALLYLEKKGFQYVAIHDAARPFVSKKLIYSLKANTTDASNQTDIKFFPEYDLFIKVSVKIDFKLNLQQ